MDWQRQTSLQELGEDHPLVPLRVQLLLVRIRNPPPHGGKATIVDVDLEHFFRHHRRKTVTVLPLISVSGGSRGADSGRVAGALGKLQLLRPRGHGIGFW